jgi:predicted small lipoprotein YifL
LNVRAGWAVIALVAVVSLAGCGDVNLGTIKKEPILNRAPGWTVSEHRESEGIDEIARINETWQAPVPPKQAKAEIDRLYKHLYWKGPGILPDTDVTIDWRSIDGKTIIGIGFYPKDSSSSEIRVYIDRG